MTSNHRTSSILRPITGEVTRPTRRRRHPAADGTPGRGLPERPLPGRPGNVLRGPTTPTARPDAPRRDRGRAVSATLGRATPTRSAAPPTAAMPLTEPLVRRTPPARRTDDRRRGSARPAERAARQPRPLTVIGEQPAPRPTRPASAPVARRDARPTEDPRRRAPRAAAKPQAARKVEAASNDDEPRKRRRGRAGRAAAPSEGTRPSALRDVTRPIARDSRMAQRRPARIGYGVIAAAIGLALVAALVVLPIRRWWNQRADLADRKSELDILRQANAQLSDDVAALNTPEGIEAAARTALNFGYPGEERTRTVGDPQASAVLPAGFPYSLVNAILASRVNLAAAPAGPGTTAAGDPAADVAPIDSGPPATTTAPEPTIAPPPGNPLSPAP